MQRGSIAISFFLVLCCTFSAQGISAQSTSRLPLRQFFELLKTQEQLDFSFVLEDVKDVWVDTTSVKTWVDLKDALPDLGFQFRAERDGLFLIAPSPPQQKTKGELTTLQISDGLEPLIGASVLSSNGKIWITDTDGKVVIEDIELQEELTIRYVGYVTKRLENVDQQTTLISMRRDTMMTAVAEVVGQLPTRLLKPVFTVQSNKDAEAFNAQRLPPVALNSFGFIGAAGVNTIDGQRSMPAIRGSQGSETMVEVDGLPLYNVDHFFGLFSAVNPQAVEVVNLYRSHYPADRGGFRGGLMDIKTKPNNANSIQLDVDQLAAAATVTGTSGPIRVLASGRSSLGNVAGTSTFQEAGSVNDAADGITTVTTPDFAYHDMYARIDIQPSGSKWSGMINGYTSMDEYSYGSDSREIIDENRRPRTLEGMYLEESSWRNFGFSGSLHYQTEKQTYTLSAYRTDYEQTLNADSEFSITTPLGSRAFEVLDNALQNTITDQQAELSVRSGEDENSWSAGVQAQFLQTQARFRFGERTPLDIDQSGPRFHAFATRMQPLGERLLANLGLRATQATDLEEAWLSPRAILNYSFLPSASAKTSSLRAGYSYTIQAARTLQHENQFGQSYAILVLDIPNRNEQPRAHNLTLGYTRVTSNFKLDFETYYRRLPGLIATLSSTIGTANDRSIGTPTPTFATVVGQGEVLGIDLDFSYETGPYSGQVAYTVARSLQKFKAIANGTWQRAPDDRRHRFATSHTYTKGRWSGGFNYEAASGLVYNDLNAVSEVGFRTELDPNLFQEQLPSYHRVDLFGRFEQPFGKTPELDLNGSRVQKCWTLGLRLYNAFDRANVSQRQYILNLNTDAQRPVPTALGTDVALLGRVLLVEGGLRF